MGGRKLFKWILWICGTVLGIAKFAADWIGRSTVAEDATDLWGKLKPMIDFLQRQPDLWFYALMLAMIAFGVFLAFWDRIPSGNKAEAPPALPLPNPEPPKLPTIEDLSKSDFSDTLKLSQDIEYKELGYKARANLCFNMDAHSKFLLVYFPRSPYLANLIEGLADAVPSLVDKMQGGMQVSFKDPGDITDVNVMSAPFANRVYVYFEDRLSLQDAARLDQLYRDKGLSLVMRGYDYLTSRW